MNLILLKYQEEELLEKYLFANTLQVMMCEKKDTKELYAIKSLRKEHILDKNQIEHTKAERRLLEEIEHPFLVSLEYAF